jgi:flagellar motor switch protein FliN/FliY
MADNLDFDSFQNTDDLDWSALEKDAKQTDSPQPGGGTGDANAAKLTSGSKKNIDINYLLDVNLEVTVEVGRRQYYISQLLGWDHGAILELDRLVGEPLNVLVNNKPVAKGEVVVVNDKFAVKITSIMDPKDRLAFLSH